MRYVLLVFGSTGFMDSLKGGVLKVFDEDCPEEAKQYANTMMGTVEKWPVEVANPLGKI